MPKMSRELEQMLTEFMLVEIGGNALDGITYALLVNGDKDNEEIQRYKKIREEVTKCGYSDTQIFRVYPLSNGYIFDMDLDITKKLTTKIAKKLSEDDPSIKQTMDLIGDHPEKRRRDDMVALGRYIAKKFNDGHRKIEVALFSRNSTNRITITGRSTNDKDDRIYQIIYNAYALRPWDLELVNERLLRPNGMRVSSLQPCEILPTKTGVSFILTLEMA